VSRQPGYETTDGAGYDYESRREMMTGRPGVFGRPRGAGERAAAPRARQEQSDLDLRRKRLRLLELAG
jgi:hypothetical protein